MHQSGFTPGDSSVHQLVYLYNSFCKALNDKKDVRIVFCDQSKALIEFGIKDFCTNWNVLALLVIF